MKERRLVTLAGTGAKGTAGVPGPALQAQLGGPHGVVTHPRTGDLYIADSRNHRVLRIKAPCALFAQTTTRPATSAALPAPPPLPVWELGRDPIDPALAGGKVLPKK